MLKMSLRVDISNENSILLLIFSLLLFLCSSLPTTKADPLYTICSPSPNYAVNSAFELNLKQVLQSLPSNTSLSGFHNTSIASGSKDPVFGLGLCRGDISSVDCQSCIRNASLGIAKYCPNGKDATIFYELCQVRYSYQNFFSNMLYAGKYPNWTTSKQNELEPEQFTRILKDFLGNISSKAASDTSNSLFATGETSLTKTTMLYGLGQCTKDIARDSCQTCLEDSTGDLIGCCSSYTGGIIVSTSCNLRYELYRFYRVVQVAGRPPPPPGKSTRKNRRKRNESRVGIITAVSILAVVALFGFCLYYVRRTKGAQRDDGETSQPERGLLNDMRSPTSVEFPSRNTQTQDDKNQMDNKGLPLMEFSTLKVATDDFSESNKLGQGGFGIVYKGKLLDGNEIAVKRLSRKSWQGLGEFKNEIILIARLQHRNLVRLLGCSIEGEEKLLIYEFMTNKSLDLFLFDQERRSELGWETRFNIIIGISRGLLYLHEDSRLKIIHRDLKPNNVLLDHEMNAKISDFGMARIFGENQSQANTKRVVGTCGYMAPEYAMEGLFSVKSDVYSFGVVLLEILSGKRSNRFYLTEHAQSLLAYAWHLWNEGRSLDFIDSLLIESCPVEEVLRCLHIGLLCVQEDAVDRPKMSSVVVMLSSNESIDLPQPTHPAFSVGRVTTNEASSSINCSGNDLTISTLTPR